MTRETCLVTGAAGFIGSHLVDRLLRLGSRVIGVDNFALGRWRNLAQAKDDPGFVFIEADLNDCSHVLQELERNCEDRRIAVVWHLAANSDIQAGATDPEVDLRNTFLSTFNVLKVMKALGCLSLVFASSSAIYGSQDSLLTEDSGPVRPISNYGAMKLASEGLISAAIENYLERAWIFRFPNVVGSRATHGVIVDLIKKLQHNSQVLDVLGDGKQDKPYLHVSELVEAMLFIYRQANAPLNVFNIGPDGSSSTVRYIAEAVVRECAPGATIRYVGGAQGWRGDVPRFAYSVEKLRWLGWTPRLASDQAVDLAIRELVEELECRPKL